MMQLRDEGKRQEKEGKRRLCGWLESRQIKQNGAGHGGGSPANGALTPSAALPQNESCAGILTQISTYLQHSAQSTACEAGHAQSNSAGKARWYPMPTS